MPANDCSTKAAVSSRVFVPAVIVICSQKAARPDRVNGSPATNQLAGSAAEDDGNVGCLAERPRTDLRDQLRNFTADVGLYSNGCEPDLDHRH